MGKSKRLECDNCHCAPSAEVSPSSAAVTRSKQVDHLFAKMRQNQGKQHAMQ